MTQYNGRAYRYENPSWGKIQLKEHNTLIRVELLFIRIYYETSLRFSYIPQVPHRRAVDILQALGK